MDFLLLAFVKTHSMSLVYLNKYFLWGLKELTLSCTGTKGTDSQLYCDLLSYNTNID